MKRFFSFFALAVLMTSSAMAQSIQRGGGSNRVGPSPSSISAYATQQIAINISEIAVIAVQGNVSMTISQATAGQAPDAATASATYAMTTNGSQKKITAELDTDMPTGLTLNATMAAPSGASSAGKTALSNKAVDLVTNVTKVRGSGLALSYEAVATVDADPDNVTRTVTYTITNN